jgi:hypothetical protein
MTREEELESALTRLEAATGQMEDLIETIGLLVLTFRRLFPQKPDFPKPDFDYRTGMPPD